LEEGVLLARRQDSRNLEAHPNKGRTSGEE
jgi:hypothetical protein